MKRYEIMSDPWIQHRGARFLLIAASLVLVVAGMRAVKVIAQPLLVAVFLSILSAPLLSWLRRHRVPKVVALLVTVLANVTVMALFLLMIGSSINSFARSVPRYQAQFEARTEVFLDWVESKGVDTSQLNWLQRSLPPEPQGEVAEPVQREPVLTAGLMGLGPIFDVIGSTLRGIASILSMIVLVFLIMVFLLYEAGGLPIKLRAAFGWQDEQMVGVARQIQRYLLIKTLVSLATGILVGLWLWILGVQYPLLWALTAFVFNYVPNLGSIIAAVPAVLLTLIEMGPTRALLVGLGYLVVNVAIGNFIEPHLMGRRFGISTLVVILSLIFWGWLWGPVGMLLSVPLTIILKIALEQTEDFRWLAALIGASPETAAALPAAGREG